MKTQLYISDYGWRMRLLPSIEFSDYDKQGLSELYGYRFELDFRFLNFCWSIYI